MTVLTGALILKMMNSLNPTLTAMAIMMMSVMAAFYFFKMSLLSWISFIIVITFSSGMMTLFVYAASLSPNEKMTSNKMKLTIPVVLLISISILTPPVIPKTTKTSMQQFSNQTTIIMMTLILIMTMVAINMQSYNPNQSISSSF